MSGVDVRVHVASHQVCQESDLDKVASKAPRAVVVIPQLADEESPEGWQVLGETPQRVEASVRDMLGKALHDLQHEIPEQLREHPAVKAQCSKLQDLLSCNQQFGIELRDMDGEDGAVPAWVETFLEGGDPRDHAASEWKDPIEDTRLDRDRRDRAADAEPAEPTELGSPASLKRCVIAPGNGCSPIKEANWYFWLAKSLNGTKLLQEEVLLRDFPDPFEAKREIWLKFLKEELLVGPDTVLVGHSSGAQAAMRLAEEQIIGGLVLVAACHSDLGDAGERASGYYPPRGGPWNWANIRRNTGWIVQLHSTDDPLVPVSEGRVVAEELQSKYIELSGRSHFFEPCTELLEAISGKLKLK
eukprot:s4362_g7.t1